MTDETKARMVKNISDQYAMLFDELTPYLVDNFHNFDGLDFREWFRAEYGNNMYRGMRSFARETIIAVIELRKKEAPEPIRIKLAELQPPEKLETFIEEFLSDTPIEDEEEGPVKEEF